MATKAASRVANPSPTSVGGAEGLLSSSRILNITTCSPGSAITARVALFEWPGVSQRPGIMLILRLDRMVHSRIAEKWHGQQKCFSMVDRFIQISHFICRRFGNSSLMTPARDSDKRNFKEIAMRFRPLHDRVAVKRIEADAKATTASPKSLRAESILSGIESSAPDRRRAIG